MITPFAYRFLLIWFGFSIATFITIWVFASFTSEHEVLRKQLSTYEFIIAEKKFSKQQPLPPRKDPILKSHK